MLRALRKLLFPIAGLYGLVMRVRNTLYERQLFQSFSAPVPVISIGNLSTGGTGKTPLAAYLLAYLESKQGMPAYLSRGYGRNTRGYLRIQADTMAAVQTGDEALQIANRFPHVPVAVCEDRSEGVRQLLLTASPVACVLDDAFQHRRIKRDLDLIVIDANHLPTEDMLLPAGNLREPLTGLRRAHMLIINKADPDDVPRLESALQGFGLPMAFCRPVPQALRNFQSSRVMLTNRSRAVVFSGIGNHAAFLTTIQEADITIEADYAFRDHYQFQKRDIEQIVRRHFHHQTDSANFDGLFLLTTEKDFYRMKNSSWLSGFSHVAFAYLPIELEWIKGEAWLKECVDDIFPSNSHH